MAQPLKLPVSEFAPDLPDYPGNGSSTVTNVYPRTPISYGPIGTPTPQYGALNQRCRGGAAYRDSVGNVFIFAGDAADLYQMQTGSGWQVASKIAGGYTTLSEDVWNFTYFNGDVVATNYEDNPQVMTLIGGAGFSDLTGNPPKGKYVAVVKNAFLVFANTNDPENGNMPQRVWWSAAGNHRSWPSLGSDLAAQLESGAVDLLGAGGTVQGMAPDLLNADAAIFQEYAVRRMVYSGPPSVFSFLPVENARGCIAPSSIVAYGGIAYYWAPDGLNAFDGVGSTPIGANKVDKFLLGDGVQSGDVDMGSINRVVGSLDPINRLVWWCYVSRQNAGGNPDKLLCYNWELNRFSLAVITTETIVRILSLGYTLDELFTVLGYTIDTIPAPLDSSVWLGGRLQLGIFDANHKLNFMTGAALAATVDTSEIQPVAGRRALVRNARPLVDGASAPSVSIGHRERAQDAVTYSTAVALNSMGACGVRASGRYLRARITTPAGSTWTNISGAELDAVALGSR